MDAALVAMTAKRFGCLGIVEDGRLAGIITDGDLRRALDPAPPSRAPACSRARRAR